MIALKELQLAAKHLAAKLLKYKYFIATAESCTGGLVATMLTSLAGSSGYFERGFVTYSNEAKQELLRVSTKTIEQFGAVSEQTAAAMASGAVTCSHAKVAIAITGIAGPSGGSLTKPVGTICFGWHLPTNNVVTETVYYQGVREAIRRQAALHAMQVLVEKM